MVERRVAFALRARQAPFRRNFGYFFRERRVVPCRKRYFGRAEPREIAARRVSRRDVKIIGIRRGVRRRDHHGFRAQLRGPAGRFPVRADGFLNLFLPRARFRAG